MNQKRVSQLDAAGLFISEALADESPLEPGVFLLPALCVDAAPPVVPSGKRAKWVDDAWVIYQPTVLPPSAGELLGKLMREYETRMQVIAANYPPSERESWPVQMEEAHALLANAQASTPWIDSAAQARGLTRIELATRIAAKNAAYRLVSGTLTGVRQAIEDQITAAGTDPEALSAIDVTAGWPEL